MKNVTGSGVLFFGSLVLLASYAAVVHPLGWAKQGQLKDEILVLEKKLAAAERKSPIKPTAQELDQWIEVSKVMDLAQEELIEFIDPEVVRLPKDVEEPSLYCIERFHSVTKRLNRQALAQGTTLAGDIGLNETLPGPEQIPIYLRQLEMTEKLLGLLLDQQVVSIDLVKPLEPQFHAYKSDMPPAMTELALQIVAVATTEDLIRFLYEVQEIQPAALIRQLRVQRMPQSYLKMQVTVSQFVIDRSVMESVEGV